MENPIICLDTSILIEYFRKTKKENSIFFQLSKKHSRFAVSIITKFEIYCGSTEQQMSFWDSFFEKIMILPFDEKANEQAVLIYKDLRKKNKLIEMPDILIGAIAKSHGMKMATNNLKHFHRINGLEFVVLETE